MKSPYTLFSIREWKARQGGTLSVPVQVLLRRGVYELPETLEFTPEDSGPEACPITWAAYPGESVTLSGGRRLGGWRHGAKVLKGKVLN